MTKNPCIWFDVSFDDPTLLWNKFERPIGSWIEISINTDISVLEFYGYIRNIGEISMNIFTQISMRQKLSKIDENA